MKKDELEKIYRENSLYEACKILNVSKVTLIRYVKKAGIKPKGKGNRNPKSKIKIED